MPINLDIFIETEAGDDHYLTRSWNFVPEVGDTIVHTTGDPDQPDVWEGVVKNRLFCTEGDEGNMRVQLHCEAPTIFDRKKGKPEPEAAPDTL